MSTLKRSLKNKNEYTKTCCLGLSVQLPALDRLCLARDGLGLVLQSSLRTGPHPATRAPASLPLDLLTLFLLLAVFGSGQLSISTVIRESASIFSASGGTSSGVGTTVTPCLFPKASPDPGWCGCCCCSSCRVSCPCAPSGTFSLPCGEVPSTLSLIHI